MAIISNFVVFEGGDGSGTSTQLGILRRRFNAAAAGEGWLRRRDAAAEFAADSAQAVYRALPPFHDTFEPSDGPVGRLVRAALRGEISLLPETLARLFAADRTEHLYGPGGILERTGRGELVVSDRYIPSSLVYQGIACGRELPERLNAAFPLPEALLFFDLEPETAQKRMEGREIREIYETLPFQTRVREGYRALLPRYREAGVRVAVIDASKSPEEVAGEVWRALENLPILS
jgi:dTMP kinase